MPNKITPEQIKDTVRYMFTVMRRAYSLGVSDAPEARLGALEAIEDRAEDVAKLLNEVP